MDKEQKAALKEKKKRLNTYARFSGIGIQMGLIIVVGAFTGVKLDENFPNKNNLYTVVFSVAAVIGSIIYGIRCIIAASKEDN